jgi:Na+/H+ antiporter NhaD/arsenite permease-like protein
MFAIIVLALVFLLIAFRKLGPLRFEIWQVMLLGALAVLLTVQITPLEALRSINLDVMLFLFGMFVIGRALEDSGYLSHISYRFFKRAATGKMLLLYILFVFGFLSAFIMNDTVAIIGTPVVLLIATKHQMEAKPLILALAFAITIGSVMSPIGNPQNLLIAVNSGMQNPFLSFFRYLFIPTVINLFIAYMFLVFFYKDNFKKTDLIHSQEPIRDHNLAILSRISIILLGILVLMKVLLLFLHVPFDFKLVYIALISMIPVLFSPKRIQLLKSIDWHTLIFFISMFILMESVWQTLFIQAAIAQLHINILSTGSILAVSIALSQLISNVPLVALYQPMLVQAGASTRELMALAAGSTIAGNLLILGAASNVIIIQNVEKRSKETITFLDFARIGIPITVVNALVYWVFIGLLRI